MSESFQTKNWIWLRAKFRGQDVINVVNVYGPLDIKDKQLCWEKLSELLVRFNNEPICLMGDFNCVRANEDRANCNFSSRGIIDFNAFLRNNNLLEINPVGVEFTWFGPFNRKSKLDHIFVNDLWMGDNSWVAKSWHRRNSDHCPISLYVEKADWGPKTFKAFDTWISHPDMITVLDRVFSQKNNCNNEVFSSLRNFKKELKHWSINWRDALQSRVLALEAETKRLDSQLDVNQDKKKVQQELSSCYKFQVEILKQKSRVQWAKEGDANTRFFHQAIRIRKHSNSITHLQTKGGISSDPEKIKSEIVQHFSEFFSDKNHELLFDCSGLFVRRLSQEASRSIEKEFSVEEIWLALSESGGHKAPGPDGLNGAWIKHLWPHIWKKIKAFFDSFHNLGVVPHGANSSFIVLIPKTQAPQNVSDYRPISLINSAFKLLLKVLANRVKFRMDCLIEESQSAFIKGRNISDGIFMINEIIHTLQSSKSDGLIIKLDFAKAYDSINWTCLLHVMDAMGFGRQWVSWIKAILCSTRMSVLINGVASREFSPAKGLRQGDPLAPYLFIMVGELLSRLLTRARELSIIDGIQLSNETEPISHLQYADDTILLVKNNEKSVRGVQYVLQLFQIISGLKVNFSKSVVYHPSNKIDKITSWAELLKCATGTIPFKYLGAWVGKRPSVQSFWDPMLLSIKSKLSSWKQSSLNFSGRVTLLQSCLDSIPSYWLGLHKVPSGVCNAIERFRRKFLWGEFANPAEEKRTLHLINWTSICQPKNSGGLGIQKIKEKNIAFLGKWWWKFQIDRNKKWHRLVSSKYQV